MHHPTPPSDARGNLHESDGSKCQLRAATRKPVPRQSRLGGSAKAWDALLAAPPEHHSYDRRALVRAERLRERRRRASRECTRLVARHKKNGHLRAECGDPLGKGRAAHGRYHDIGDEGIEAIQVAGGGVRMVAGAVC